jgi:hypothetical protein
MPLLLETAGRLLLEDGSLLLLETDVVDTAPPPMATPVDTSAPDYWRGPDWVGRPLVNWPRDGALR